MAFSTIQGSGGAPDSFVGTSGVDSIVFEGNTNNFFVGAQQANDYIGFDNVAALETGTYTNGTLRGGAGIDNFQDLAGGFGVPGINLVSTWLNGNSDDDIFGANFAGLRLISSTLQGGQGDDTMFVNGASNSLFNGNRDDDTLSFIGPVASSTIGGGQGDDTLTQTGGTMTGSSLLLGDGDDTFTQTAGIFGANNTVEGGDGNDTITLLAATAADAVINGGAGTDAISAGAGDDTLDGGAGNDAITGLLGADTMTGGGGANAFIYTAIAESGNVATGDVDVITDFTTGADSIDQDGVFSIDGAEILANAVATASYANALAAVNGALAVAGDQFAVVAVGRNNSWTSYLMGATAPVAPAVVATVNFVVQIGEIGAYATAAQAQAAFTGTDFTA